MAGDACLDSPAPFRQSFRQSLLGEVGAGSRSLLADDVLERLNPQVRELGGLVLEHRLQFGLRLFACQERGDGAGVAVNERVEVGHAAILDGPPHTPGRLLAPLEG